MPIVITLAAAGALFLLQQLLYKLLWSKGLFASVDLGRDRYIFEGEKIEVEETLVNDKWLPLPWVYFKFQLSNNGKPAIYQSDMFSIANRRRIRRKRRFTLPARGVWTIGEVDLVSHDLFLSRTYSKVDRTYPGSVTVYPRLIDADEMQLSYEQLSGDIVSRRFSLEDPYLFKGIRDYQPTDPMKSVNFRASARTGDWKVNVHETTVSQRVCLIVGMDKSTRYYDPVVYEQALRIAGTLAALYERRGVPVSLWSNGADSLQGTATEVEAGCGEDHIYDILGALARMDAEHEEGSSVEKLEQLAAEPERDTQYVLISPAYRRGMREAYEALHAAADSTLWIMPITVAESGDTYFEPHNWPEEVPNFRFWIV